jgi:hypothetical protein
LSTAWEEWEKRAAVLKISLPRDTIIPLFPGKARRRMSRDLRPLKKKENDRGKER